MRLVLKIALLLWTASLSAHSENIQLFLKEQLDLEIPVENIRLLGKSLGTGMSGNPVYRILDSNGVPILITKVFMNKKADFQREVDAVQDFCSLKLTHLNVPALLAATSYQFEKNRVAFLVTEHMTGTSLYHLCLEERSESFPKILAAYRKLGCGLAELHLAARTAPIPLESRCQGIFKRVEHNVFPLLKKEVGHSLSHKLKKYYSREFAKIQKMTFVHGYIHGDASAANFIYDHNNDQIAIVDLGGSYAKGLSYCDIARVVNNIAIKKIWGFTDHELSQLVEAFSEAYKLEGGNYPDPQTLRFFRVAEILCFVNWYLRCKDSFDSNLEELEAMYLERLLYLRKIAANPKSNFGLAGFYHV